MNNLKKIRIRKKLSQFELAKLSNIAPSDISRIENDKLYCHPGWRERLSKALNVTEKEIFSELEKEVIE